VATALLWRNIEDIGRLADHAGGRAGDVGWVIVAGLFTFRPRRRSRFRRRPSSSIAPC
jgi:hypothetical protein